MVPVLPTRFSTTTGWPSASESFGARIRATMSGPPPGGNPTKRRMARAGYWAAASWANTARTRGRKKQRISLLTFPRLGRPLLQLQLSRPGAALHDLEIALDPVG